MPNYFYPFDYKFGVDENRRTQWKSIFVLRLHQRNDDCQSDVFVDLEKLGFSFREPQITRRETSFYSGVVTGAFGEKHS
ncbi:hypothetical protein LEP1GSC130_0064 [Leptospira santarosai str. 200403458]|nr:hypothetical protein LEP1GSC130_0064 [Leptospira santarosai str. 200403458]